MSQLTSADILPNLQLGEDVQVWPDHLTNKYDALTEDMHGSPFCVTGLDLSASCQGLPPQAVGPLVL